MRSGCGPVRSTPAKARTRTGRAVTWPIPARRATRWRWCRAKACNARRATATPPPCTNWQSRRRRSGAGPRRRSTSARPPTCGTWRATAAAARRQNWRRPGANSRRSMPTTQNSVRRCSSRRATAVRRSRRWKAASTARPSRICRAARKCNGASPLASAGAAPPKSPPQMRSDWPRNAVRRCRQACCPSCPHRTRSSLPLLTRMAIRR